MESIFDAIDKDKNGVIDEKEYNQYFDQDGDSQVSKNETKKGLELLNKLLGQNAKAGGQKFGKEQKVTQQDLEKFLGICGTNSADVKSVQHSQQDGKDVVVINYNNGEIDTVFPDKSYTHEGKNTNVELNGTTSYNSEGVQTQFVGTDNNKVTINFAEDGIHYDTMSTESDIEIPGKDGAEATTLRQLETTTYIPGSDNVPEQTVLTYPDRPGEKTTLSYEDGQVTGMDVKSGTTHSTFSIDAEGKQIPQTIIENEGLPTQETTQYTYGDNKTEVTTYNAENKPLHSTFVDKEARTITTREYNYEFGDNDYTEIVQGDDSTSRTTYIDGLINQKLLYKGENIYSAQYDGKGNTLVTVQPGETLAKLASGFGCSVEDLKKLNPGIEATISSGTQINIPGELEPDDTRLEGRKSADTIQAEKDYQAQLKRAEQKATQQHQANIKQQFAAFGFKDCQGYGKKIQGRIFDDSKLTQTFTVIGRGENGAVFLEGEDGRAYVKPSPDTNPTYIIPVKTAAPYNNAATSEYNNKFGRLAHYGINEATGAKQLVDRYGNIYYLDQYGKIRPKQDLTSLSKVTKGMTERGKSAQAGVNAMNDKINSDMYTALAEYWTNALTHLGTVRDASINVAEYQKTMNKLNKAIQAGDLGTYKSTFENFFGLEFNEDAINYALSHPKDPDAMKKAFGNKRYADISKIVAVAAKQQKWTSYVTKGTVAIGVGMLTGGAGTAIASGSGLSGASATAVGLTSTTTLDYGVNIAQSMYNPETRELLLSGDAKTYGELALNTVKDEVLGVAFGGINKFGVRNLSTAGTQYTRATSNFTQKVGNFIAQDQTTISLE